MTSIGLRKILTTVRDFIDKRVGLNDSSILTDPLNISEKSEIITLSESLKNFDFLIFRVGFNSIQCGASYIMMPTYELSANAIIRILVTNELYLLLRLDTYEQFTVIDSNIPASNNTWGIRRVYGYSRISRLK